MSVQKNTLVTKVMAFLKGGDEAKVSRFSGKLEKYIDKQIAIRKEAIETINEKIIDAQETVTEAVTNIEVSEIQTAEKVETYCETYVSNLDNKLSVISELEEQIEEIEGQVSRLEELKKTIFGE